MKRHISINKIIHHMTDCYTLSPKKKCGDRAYSQVRLCVLIGILVSQTLKPNKSFCIVLEELISVFHGG